MGHRFPGVVTLSLLAMQGCGNGSECVEGETRCNGDLLQVCHVSTGHVPLSGTRYYWSNLSCNHTCVETGPGKAGCAVSDAQEPRCDGVQGFCDGTTRVTCSSGLVGKRESCSVECGAEKNDPECFPEFGCDAVLGESIRCFNEAWRIGCRDAELIQAERCETVCGGSPAICALPRHADPRCLPSATSYCDGKELVGCVSGFAVSRVDCDVEQTGRSCVPQELGGECRQTGP